MIPQFFFSSQSGENQLSYDKQSNHSSFYTSDVKTGQKIFTYA